MPKRIVWPTMMHEPDSGPPCIHLTGTMPHTITVDRVAVARLNFQPRITPHPHPVIAARRGNTLILSVHLVGPLGIRHPHRGMNRRRDRRLTHHWYFDLIEAADDPRILIAVQRINTHHQEVVDA